MTTRGTGRRLSRRPLVTLVVLGLAAIGAGSAIVASAAPPVFPDNILVFPNRDFVSVAGFADHAGETATLEVTRGTQVMGSAQAVVSGGDVAFEVNHPGGVCWGNGTSLAVTPDIVPGDKVTIKFGGVAAGDTVVQDASAIDVSYDPAVDANKVVVTGRMNLDPGVPADNIEQRTVNPALLDLIGKRDVRAIPGPLTPPRTGGYQSGLTTDTVNHTFTATYIFDSAATAKVAAEGGGERLLSWQVVDAAGNRQGVTIAERGQLGGPGFGGCPMGPADASATIGSATYIRSANGQSMVVNWTPAKPLPGAAAVTGFSVDAVTDLLPGATMPQRGARLPADATRTTITGLDATKTYTVEVRSVSGVRMSDPFTINNPVADTTVPTLTADPAPSTTGTPVEASSVTLTSNGQVFYTTDGSSAIANGDLPADNAKPYTTPIAITGPTTIDAAAFDAAGNHVQLRGDYVVPTAATPPPPPPPDPTPPPVVAKPAAPTGLTGTAGLQQVALKWNAGDSSVTGYKVKTYDAFGAQVGATVSTASTATTITGLTHQAYTFTVAAENAGGLGVESAPAGPYTPANDSVAIGTAKWKAGDFRVTGTGTVVGATITVKNASGATLGTTTTVAAVAPATGATFDFRLKNGAAPATRPATVSIESSEGGKAGPFTVG